MSNDKKVALVTGAGQGIGKAIAIKLAADCDIVVNDMNVEKANETAEEARALGAEVLISGANVTEREAVEGLFAAIDEKFGRLDILVNNAGITRDGLLDGLNDNDWDLVMEVNLKGVFLCCQLGARLMRKSGGGSIVNLSSLSGMRGNIGQVNYAASKAGVIGLTKTLAQELARDKITVNSVAPGFIRTPMTENVPDKVKEKFISTIPLARMGEAEEVAGAVAFFTSKEGAYITGQVLGVNGGMYI